MTSLDCRVGHGATSFLENITRDYIVSHTVGGEYTGKPDYLLKYVELVKYNAVIEK